MDKRRIYFILGIILAITAIFLIQSYVQSERQKLLELSKAKGIVKVVIAKQDIPARKKITPEMLVVKRIPVEGRESEALGSIDSVAGKIAIRDIIQGQQITASLILLPQSRRTLAFKTPEGKRALTIPVDKISSIEGMINPGDYVDIIGNFPFSQSVEGKTYTQNIVVPMFQNVLVLAVGTRTEMVLSKGKGKPTPASTITIALSPEEAALFTYALEVGKIKLLLRSQLDTEVVTTREPVTMDKLWEKLLGIRQVVPVPPPPPDTVEIYRGTEKSSLIVEEK